MIGVESALNVGGSSQTRSGQSGSQPASGALTASRQGVAEALGNTGFVYITGQLHQNFQTYLDRTPFGIEVGDLKPGMLTDLANWVAAILSSADAEQALETQARAEPQRAVKLLA
jgi:hypothetical protein